jgi:hypothetical protein
MATDPPPSTTGANGRGPRGRFIPGNKAAKGNPFAKRVAALRASLYEAVTPADMEAVVKKLVIQAKAGDVASIKELLQRLLGPAEAIDLNDRLAAMEAQIEQLVENDSKPRRL